MAKALREDKDGDVIMQTDDERQPEPERKEEEKDEEAVRTTVTNEYRNVRAIHGSKQYINDATAAGHKPNLYFLTETWWETDKHPELDEYTLIAHVLGKREYVTGRAKGGVAVYKHNDCHIPTRPRKLNKGLTDAIAIEIGETVDGKEKIAILAYYLAATTPQATRKYFNAITDELNKMEEEGYRTFLLGDSNGDRDKTAKPETTP
jgi:hypothetical protein